MQFPFPTSNDWESSKFHDNSVESHGRKRKKKDAYELEGGIIKKKKIKSAIDSEKSLNVIVGKAKKKTSVSNEKISDIRMRLLKPNFSETDMIFQTNEIRIDLNTKIDHNSKNVTQNLMNKQLSKPHKKKIKNKFKIFAVQHSKADTSCHETEFIFDSIDERESSKKLDKLNPNSKNVEQNLLNKKLSRSQKKKMKKKLKIFAVQHSNTNLSRHETESIYDSIDESKISNKLNKSNVDKPKMKKIKNKLNEISEVENLKTHSSCKTESNIIDERKVTEKSLLLINNNDRKPKIKKIKKKVKEISSDEHRKAHLDWKTKSDSIDGKKIIKKALLLKTNNERKPEIKKKFKEISSAEYLKPQFSCHKEESVSDFIDERKVTKKSLLYKNNGDKPRRINQIKKFNEDFTVEPLKTDSSLYDSESISYSKDKEKVSKKEFLQRNNKQITKKKSNIPPANISNSSEENIFVSENGSSDDDDELIVDLKNSKEFKNLMHYVNRQSDQSQKIIKNAECGTKKEFPFESNDQESFIPTKLNHSENDNKFIAPLKNTKQNVLLKTNSLSKSNILKNKAQKCLQAARFRLLNEKLYTVSGKEALEYFKANTDDFKDYHEGYRSQVMKWPVNPVDLIIKDLYNKGTNLVIADMGCGEAKIATTFPDRKIYSFDLIALNKHVTRCEFSKVNLNGESVDIVVFCLSLMGTNLKDYLCEAHRILKFGGELKIAEVESRIENLSQFVNSIEHCGFKLEKKNVSHKVFVFLDFSKVKNNLKKGKVPTITLKACMYKKR